MAMVRVGMGEQHTAVLQGGSHSFEVMSGGVCELMVWGGAEVTVSLLEEGAECRIRGLVITGENSGCEAENVALRDVQCTVRHLAPNCTSEQLFRAVVGGKCTAHFRGMIYVAKGAVGTQASQYSNGVILGSGAKIQSDPQMEVYADDVKCNHGATVGGRNEQALFYMMQRGILRADAEKLLLESFCFGVVDGLSLQETDSLQVMELIREKVERL